MMKHIKLVVIIILVLIMSMIPKINNQKDIINNKDEKIVKELTTKNNQYKNEISQHKKQNELNKKEIRQLKNEKSELESIIKASRGENNNWIKVKATSYDLSVRSCGKRKSHPEYGLTYTGYNLRGKNYKTARVIAVDPRIIPLGSKVKIYFTDSKYYKYNGIYTAADTGSFRGKHIDLFYEDTGEKVSKNAIKFGLTKAYIKIIK